MTRLILALACALAIVASSASAQDYPNKPIKLIVSFGPGGGADIVGRILGQAMAEKLGQPVVIENRPGAAGTIGNEGVARAEKDGYTLGIMTAGQIIAAVMNKSLRYDTATAFEPIGQVATASLIIVARPDVPAAAESGVVPGYDVTTWYGFFGPRGMPREIVTKLNKVLNESIKEPAVAERLIKAGVTVHGSTPEAFGKFMADELARWTRV